jgi:hypothetical protein
MSAVATVSLSRLGAQNEKKWKAVITTKTDGRSRTVCFGANGYEDFTMHKDDARKQRYIARHGRRTSRERWSLASGGLYTAGFWSRWLLWNKPSIKASVADMRSRFPSLRIKVL